MQPSIGKWMRKELDARGWTAGGLAERVGVTRQAAQQWAGGHTMPRREQWVAIVDAFALEGSARMRAHRLYLGDEGES